MTTAQGTYSDCGPNKNFSITINCTGPDCGGFALFPTLQCTNSTNQSSVYCTNNIQCDNSNFTSVFFLNQPSTNSNVTLAENLTVGSLQFQISVDSTGNASYINKTASNAPTKSSAGYRTASPSNVFILLVMMLSIFTGSVYGQAASIAQIEQGISAALPSFFHSILPTVEKELCGYIGGQIISRTLTGDPEYDVAIAELTTFCLEAIETVEALTGVAEAIGATVIGLVPLEFGNVWACNYLAGRMLLPGQYAEVTQICSIFVSDLNPPASVPPASVPPASVPVGPASAPPSIPPVSTPSSVVSSPVSIPPANPSPGPPLPTGSALAQNQCASCQLSLYFLGVEGLAEQCHVATPLGFSNDISVTFCDPSIVGTYGQLCANLCANPCATYDAVTWIQEAGSGFMANANLPLCSQLCPDFKGTGKCFLTPPCNQCGIGAETCLSC